MYKKYYIDFRYNEKIGKKKIRGMAEQTKEDW
jgi:hypothetical protein